ncbi:MAG TPA: VOC family protein [Gaiellaceae bacterium]|nr:VOC family protein [Gaiellaceae bacterium]
MSTVTTKVGTFVWHEHVSTDRKQAQDFYAQLLGWEYEVFKPGEVDYAMITTGGQMHGGFPPVPEGTPSMWTGNVQVESTDDTVAKAQAAGGTLINGPIDIPEVGRHAVIADPQGAVVAVFQPEGGDGPQAEGVFVWDELGTQDVDASESFYSAVFGWTTNDMGEEYGGYKVFQSGETRVAGLMKLPDPNIPSMWAPYVAVDDVDATIAKAKELGGSAIMDGMDVPNIGRIGMLKDPQGAVLGIIKPNQEM